jgi:hypothetical protein
VRYPDSGWLLSVSRGLCSASDCTLEESDCRIRATILPFGGLEHVTVKGSSEREPTRHTSGRNSHRAAWCLWFMYYNHGRLGCQNVRGHNPYPVYFNVQHTATGRHALPKPPSSAGKDVKLNKYSSQLTQDKVWLHLDSHECCVVSSPRIFRPGVVRKPCVSSSPSQDSRATRMSPYPWHLPSICRDRCGRHRQTSGME